MRWRCFNPRCPGKAAELIQFEFEAATRRCPQCGATGDAIIPILIHHFLIQDPNGLITGQFGIMHSIACAPKATILKLAAVVQVQSIEPFLVNCPRCLDSQAWRDAAQPLCEKFATGLVDARMMTKPTPEAKAKMEELKWL